MDATIPAATFLPLAIQTGLLLELSGDAFPTCVAAWNGGALALTDGGTHYGMVTTGQARLIIGDESYLLRAGMFLWRRERRG